LTHDNRARGITITNVNASSSSSFIFWLLASSYMSLQQSTWLAQKRKASTTKIKLYVNAIN